jgi:hypothetical protein
MQPGEQVVASAQQQDLDKGWRSCCWSIDARVFQFLAQVIVCGSVAGFCMYQLVHKPDCHDQQMYMSTLTFVLGVFVPQPRVHGK